MSERGRLTQTVHLARRFFGSILARPLDASERAWVERVLTPAELDLWVRQRRDDQRHTYGVAREVEAQLAGASERDGPWVAAALLHDIGKLEAGLGVVGRAVATVVGGAIGRSRVAAWGSRSGLLGRMGRYIDHPRIGADMLQSAGGRDDVARWARVHHDADIRAALSDRVVPDRAVRALLAADRD